MKSALISQLRYSDTGQSPHSHYHLSCEMVLVCEGEAEFWIDGRRYLASKNSIVFISSYEPHEIRIRQTPYRRYFAMVQAAELERIRAISECRVSSATVLRDFPIVYRCRHLGMNRSEFLPD